MNRWQKIGSFLVLAALATFAISPVFQNCAKTNYGTISSGIDSLSLASRKIVIDPSFEKTNADVKILFVVDDSFTMSQSQEYLSHSIDSLLNGLRGRNASFKVVSTSGVPDNAIDYSSDVKYYNESQQEVTAAQITNLSSYIIEKHFDNISARNAEFKIPASATDGEFSNIRYQIKNAILSVGTNGSSKEEGLCAIARQLFDSNDTRFFKSGDKAGVVLISDEDDASSIDNCTYKTRQRISNKELVYYNYKQQRARLTLEVQRTVDGISQWLSMDWGVPLEGEQSITEGGDCTAEHRSFATTKIQNFGYQIRNVSKCKYEISPAAYLGADLGDDGTNSGKDFCSQAVMFNNKTYGNLYAMANANAQSVQPGSCVRTKSTGLTQGDLLENRIVFSADSAAMEAKSLPLALLNQANNLFGSSSFFISTIVHRIGEACTLQNGQSLGVKYASLGTQFSSQLLQSSICDTDYSPALAKLSGFVVDVVNKSYVASIADDEKIAAVAIVRGETTNKLAATDYEANGGTILIKNFEIQAGDKIEVYVSKKN